MKNLATRDLKIGDVIRKPINLRGAEIHSMAEVEGQIVCFVVSHPDPSVNKFHADPGWVGFEVERPDHVEDVLYEAECTCVITRNPSCPAHGRIK